LQLESIYRSATVVANICVHAATDRNKPIAIIVPAEPALKKLASDNGIEGNSLEELVHNEKLNGLVLRELQAAGKRGGLAGTEIIDGVVMADEEWTAANVSAVWFCSEIQLIKFLGLDYCSTKDKSESYPAEVPKRG